MAAVTHTFGMIGQTHRVRGRKFYAITGADGGAAWSGTVQFCWMDSAGNTHIAASQSGTKYELTANDSNLSMDFGPLAVKAWLQCTGLTSGQIPVLLASDGELVLPATLTMTWFGKEVTWFGRSMTWIAN
jgi:hypothetical protein